MQGTAAQKQALIKDSNQKAGIGFLLILASIFLMPPLVSAGVPEGAALVLAIIVRVTGVVMWVWGLRLYAMSKGYHPAWGFLGLLWIIGLIVLVLLPNRYVVVPEGTEGDYPRSGHLY